MTKIICGFAIECYWTVVQSPAMAPIASGHKGCVCYLICRPGLPLAMHNG